MYVHWALEVVLSYVSGDCLFICNPTGGCPNGTTCSSRNFHPPPTVVTFLPPRPEDGLCFAICVSWCEFIRHSARNCAISVRPSDCAGKNCGRACFSCFLFFPTLSAFGYQYVHRTSIPLTSPPPCSVDLTTFPDVIKEPLSVPLKHVTYFA